MRRRHPRSIGTVRDVIPANSGACRGCMDLMCAVCFGDLARGLYDDDDLDALHAPEPWRMVVEIDDDTYAALDRAAGRSMTLEDAARAVLREWAKARR